MKKLLSILLAFACVVGIASAEIWAEFSDIDNHWAKEHISKMQQESIISGYPDNSFQPENTITRGEFATILFRLCDEPAADYEYKTMFDDAFVGGYPRGDAPFWALPVNYLADMGIVNGYEDEDGGKLFRPNNEITREEAATIIDRFLQYKKYSYPYAANGGLVMAFVDHSQVSDWAYYGVFNLARRSNGIMSGYLKDGDYTGDSDGQQRYEFKPQNNITRAEVAKIVSVIFDELNTSDK
ncbi:MAG: S-layer homology domain-containing protein [Clostridiales bacterium]|jgi:hypothetical protein|nr:S-layer homology domain-containing protein [Clostridiales bacterium]